MKVLQICRNIPIKNLEGNPILLNLFSKLRDEGYDSDIIFPSEYIPNIPFLPKRYKTFSSLNSSAISFNGFHVSFFKFIRLPFFFSFYLVPFFVNFFNVKSLFEKYDVIHAHYILPDGLLAMVLSEKLNIPYIITVRQGDIDRLTKLKKESSYWNIYKKVLISSKSIISVNSSIKKYLKEEFDLEAIIIPHGIDESLISGKATLRNGHKMIVSVVSQMIERKNVNYIIDAVIEMNDNGEDVILNIVGDGPLLSFYKEKYKYPFINFHGLLSKEKVLDVMKNSHVFTLPSSNETFGMVYLEAAACGAAIVGKKNTGVDGIFTNNKDAIFIANYKELLYRLKDFYYDDDKRLGLISNSFDLLRSELTWGEVIKKYLKVYNG